MTLRTLGLTAAVAAALAAGAAAAAQGPPGPADHRGPPDGEEGRPQLFISPAGQPFRAPPGAPYPVVVWFSGADADHDGALSRDEFVADALRFFATLDTDHNEVIDGFEVSNYERNIAPEIIGARPPGPRRGGPGGPGPDDGGEHRPPRAPAADVLQGAAPYGLIAEPEPVMAADGDLDRRVTQAEAIRAAKTRFALLDADKDGKLTLDELPRTVTQGALPGGRRGRGGRAARPGTT